MINKHNIRQGSTALWAHYTPNYSTGRAKEITEQVLRQVLA